MLGIGAGFLGALAGFLLFFAVEAFVLRYLNYGDRTARLNYAVIAAAAGFLSASFCFGLMLVLYGVAWLTAFGEVEDAGELLMKAGTDATVLFPVLTYLLRLFLFNFFGLGTFQRALVYSLTSSVIAIVIVTASIMTAVAIAT